MIKKLIYINLIFAIVLNWFSTNPDITEYGFSYLGILPKQTFALVELLSIVIFVLVIRKLLVEKKLIYSLLIVGYILLFYFPYTLLWEGSTTNYLTGVRSYASFIPMFVGGYYLSKIGESVKPYLILITILCLVQLPATIFQYMFSFPLLNRGTEYDVVSGTMGGINGNLMAVLISSVIIVLLRFYMTNNKKWLLLVCLALIIPCILAEAKGIFPLLFIGGSLLLFQSKVRKKNKVKILGTSLILFLIMAFSYSLLIERDRQPWDPMYYIEYEENKAKKVGPNVRLSRTDSFIYANELLFSKTIGPIFGLGVGNASTNKLPGNDGIYYSRLTIVHYWDKTLTEIGYFGIALLIILFLYFRKKFQHLEKKSRNPIIKSLAGGMAIVIPMTILAGFYTDHLAQVQFSYPFFFITGYLLSQTSKVKNVSKYYLKENLNL